jgi:hypothetical protein
MRKCGARCGRKGLVGCRLRSPSGSAGCVSGDGEGPVGLRCILAVCPRGCGSRYSWAVAERASMTTMGQVAAAEVRANVMERQGRAGGVLAYHSNAPASRLRTACRSGAKIEAPSVKQRRGFGLYGRVGVVLWT